MESKTSISLWKKEKKNEDKIILSQEDSIGRKKKTKKKQSDEWDDVCDVTSLSYSLLSLHE